MGRPENALDPHAGPVEEFASALRLLRDDAGRPTYRELASRSGYSASALKTAARGDRLPTLPVVMAFAVACGADEKEWERRWRAAAVAAAETGADDASADDAGSGNGRSPYLGLAAYQMEDADRFFGRDRLVADLLALLKDQRTFKAELIHRQTWRTRDQVEYAIVEWIGWYNHRRLSLGLPELLHDVA